MLTMFAERCQCQPDSAWVHTYGGFSEERYCSVIQTPDNGYVLTGATRSFGVGFWDFWLVMTDENGDSLWSRTYGGEELERCYSMVQTIDGGFVLAGETTSFGAGEEDFWLLKTDANGDSLWSQTYGGSESDRCQAMVQTIDGGFALAGQTWSSGAGEWDFWLVRTDANGDSLWSRTYGGSRFDVCNALIETPDGGFALAGHTSSFGSGYQDFWLVKTDENGDSLWSRTFGGEHREACQSIVQNTDGGFLLAGCTGTIGSGNLDFWLIRTDANGNSLWSRTFGGDNSETCYSILRTADDEFLLSGDTRSFGAGSYDYWLVLTNENGDSLGSKTFGDTRNDQSSSMIQTADGGFVLAGTTEYPSSGSTDFWLVKTGSDPLSVANETVISKPVCYSLLNAYPNPFNSTTISYGLPFPSNVSLQLYNPLGQRISALFEGKRQAGIYSANLSGRDLASGLYFVRLEGAGEVVMRKVLLVR